MTSDVSALSSSVGNGHQAIPTFPLPPLKFRTVGFPQYGFKRSFPVATFATAGLYATVSKSVGTGIDPGDPPGTRPGAIHRFVQWPLAPQ